MPAVKANAALYDDSASAPAATGPTTFAMSPDIEDAANTGPPRPSTTSPMIAPGATSSSPEPKPSTAIATRNIGSDCTSASRTNAEPEIAQPAMRIGRRPTRSAKRPAGSSTRPLTPATHQKPMPVQITPSCSASLTNSGISAARTPIDAHESAKTVASAAR